MFVASGHRFANCNQVNFLPRFFQVQWFDDFLFVSVRPRMSLLAQIEGLQSRLQAISANISKRREHSNYTYECYWPIAVENALEPYHIDKIHSQTLGLLKLEDGVNHYLGRNSIWDAPIGDRNTDKKLRSLARMFEISGALPGYEFIYLFPFTMISSTYGYSYSMQNFFPGKGGMTSFYSRLCTSKTINERAETILEPFFASTVAVNQRVFEEDHEVCKLVPAGSWSSEPLRFAADNEGKIQHFRQSCRDHIATT